MVTQDEIIEALREADTRCVATGYRALANRIHTEGISPPDGYMLVKKRKPCVASCQRFDPDGGPCDCQN